MQEHGLEGEPLDRHVTELNKMGWDAIADCAYQKTGGLGGGTAILVSDPAGIRPVQKAEVKHTGRVTLGITNFGFDVLIISLYGITSAGISQQLELWKYIVGWIRWLGIPYLIGGDIQVTPAELKKSGLCRLINPIICAPRSSTTTLADRATDYCIVSPCLLEDEWQVQTMMQCSFRPHFPVVLSIRCPTTVDEVTRLAMPKPLPVERPIGPTLPGDRVDWNDWEKINKLESHGTTVDLDDIDEVASDWYVGAEAELMAVMGAGLEGDATSYLGIGKAVKIVQDG